MKFGSMLRIVPRSRTMPGASYRPPFKVRSRHVCMVSFGGFGVAQISMLSQVRCSARKARQAYATRVLSVRLFSAPFFVRLLCQNLICDTGLSSGGSWGEDGNIVAAIDINGLSLIR